MRQSDILKASYEKIYDNLSELGRKEDLFLMSNKGIKHPETDTHSLVCLGFSDVCQLCPDKNGEKVEENETIFETPARIGCMLSINIVSKQYNQLLEAVGLLVQYFKDNNEIILDEYKCHGEEEGKIYIEPVIRKVESQQLHKINDFPVITLEYQMEMGINSLKGTKFKRVDKIDLKMFKNEGE